MQGECPMCGDCYDVNDTQVCPECEAPLWPMTKEPPPRNPNDLTEAKGPNYVDINVMMNDSFIADRVLHFRTFGCWCHPEKVSSQDGGWVLRHHSETRN